MLWFKKKLKLLTSDKVQCDFCCAYTVVGGSYLHMGAGIVCKECAWTFYSQLKKMIEDEQARKAAEKNDVQKSNNGKGQNGAMLYDLSKGGRKGADGSKGRDKPT